LNEEGKLLKINDLVDAYIRFALERNGGAKDKTARELGIDRKTLYRRLQEPAGAAAAAAEARETQVANAASAH
jgi:DNA-binding NtrC family response regulator